MSNKIIVNPYDPSRCVVISPWNKWFAWYPVKLNDKRVWLKTVYRRDFSRHTMAGSKYWTEYKSLFDILTDDEV